MLISSAKHVYPLAEALSPSQRPCIIADVPQHVSQRRHLNCLQAADAEIHQLSGTSSAQRRADRTALPQSTGRFADSDGTHDRRGGPFAARFPVAQPSAGRPRTTIALPGTIFHLRPPDRSTHRRPADPAGANWPGQGESPPRGRAAAVRNAGMGQGLGDAQARLAPATGKCSINIRFSTSCTARRRACRAGTTGC